jgi:hypothetical protein
MEGLSQRVLHQGFCDPLWDVAFADRTHAEKGISAGGDEEVSAASRGSGAADPGGVAARDQHSQVGRVVAAFTGERVSPQTVSRITQELDQAVKQFHQARLDDDWAYLFLDGVSLRVRRPVGRKQVQMLVAYGVKRDDRSGFIRAAGQ